MYSMKSNSKVEIYKQMLGDTAPLVLWGVGDCAKNVIRFCTNYGIKISSVVLSREYKIPENGFEGYEVFYFDEIDKIYDEYSVVLGFANYEKADELAAKDSVHKVYLLTSDE